MKPALIITAFVINSIVCIALGIAIGSYVTLKSSEEAWREVVDELLEDEKILDKAAKL